MNLFYGLENKPNFILTFELSLNYNLILVFKFIKSRIRDMWLFFSLY